MLTRESPRARAADSSPLTFATVLLMGLALFAHSYLGGLPSRQAEAVEAARTHELPVRLRGSAALSIWTSGVIVGVLLLLSLDPLQHPLSATRVRLEGVFDLAILFAATAMLSVGIARLSDVDIDASAIGYRVALLRMKRIEFSDVASIQTQSIPRGGVSCSSCE